ncbi:tRNA (adenosine(37)-N6)-threonylcarbamoyltransferase complex dimerization subunit type 1 TsaB [Ottowia thiooxydans]|uniref:tRNA (adenosine(37)-N6)-threonylcarbamoyltransferase complex dimerization subunit type 1 TsaB n=1 Tax=Ottowia thiooxydans TaxID=219182 RepID=UPI000400BED8|nr:tRNA (adenosine(37)-N6)-threonylcarbamoyltransferase complex dimerization subunit type 1 TsaB [Ottowia thiooxydans]
MKLLAFDTSTELLSIAVRRDGREWVHSGAGGAKSSAALIPCVLDLLAKAELAPNDLDAIVFGRGPGSFTGLRTACSVAQGLAFGARRGQGAGVPVLPVDTLLAVAEVARMESGATRVLALLDARMDEVYSAAHIWEGTAWATSTAISVGKPEQLALPAGEDWVLAGNVWAAYGERVPTALADLPRIEAVPNASALLSLAPAMLSAGLAVSADQALPLYIRDKVAQTTAERAVAKS